MQNLLKLYFGTFKEAVGDFRLSSRILEAIERDVVGASRFVPALYGCRMPPPFQHMGWMTAEDCSNFLLHYGPPALQNRLPAPYYNHFLALREITLELLQLEISTESVAEGGSLTKKVQRWYLDYEA